VDVTTFPKNDSDPCEPCIQCHQTRNLNDTPMRRLTEPGDLIHSYIFVWINPTSIGEERYFLIFIDDATRYIRPLRKCEIPSLFSATNSNRTADVSNRFEPTGAANTANRWNICDRKLESSTKRRHRICQKRMASQRVPTASFAPAFNRSLQKEVFPRSFGQNSHATSCISKTAVQPVRWT